MAFSIRTTASDFPLRRRRQRAFEGSGPNRASRMVGAGGLEPPTNRLWLSRIADSRRWELSGVRKETHHKLGLAMLQQQRYPEVMRLPDFPCLRLTVPADGLAPL
jgi:hypothetical protein